MPACIYWPTCQFLTQLMPRSVSHSGSRSPPRRPAQRQARRSPTPEQSPPKPAEENQEPKIYISGLPSDANKDELRESFGEFGEIVDIFVVNKDSFSFGFVTYDNHKSARQAIDNMSGKEIRGKNIKCAYAKPRPEGGRNNGPRGGGAPRGKGCFKCGQDGHFARQCPNAEGEGNSRGPPRNDFNSRGQGNNRGGDRFKSNTKSESNEGSPRRKPMRKRSQSGSRSPPKRRPNPKRSSSGSASPAKRSPIKRRQKRSSSGSASPRKGAGRHQRSRSAELRKGKKKGSSSGSR